MADKRLSIILSGDGSALISELKKAGGGANEFGGVLSKLAKSHGVELSTAIQGNVKQLEILRDHLVKINAPASDVAKVTAKLAEEQRKYDQSLAASSASTGKFGGVLQQHGAAIGATLTAIGGAALMFGKQSIGAFEESEIALAQLENVIRSTGGVAGVTSEEVQTLSAAIQKQTGISDEAVTTAQSMLLSFTKIGHDVFPEVTQAVADMSTFMNKGAVPSMEQMQGAAITIGKAMQSPVEGVAALQRQGVRLSESQKELVKDLVSTGRTAEAQAVILKELKTEFGGAAEAAGKTFSGQVKIAREEMNDFQEDVGGKIVPVLQGLMRDFPDASKGAILLGDSIGGLNIRAGDLLVALPLMKTAFGGLGLSSIASGFSGIGSAIGLINPIALLAVAGLSAFAYAYAKISEEKAVNATLRESIDLMQKFIDLGTAAGISADGLRTLRVAAGEAASKLGETRTEAQIFTEMVQKAIKDGIKPMTGEIGLWATAQDKLKLAIDYTRPSLAAQIKALESEIATMKKSGTEKEMVWKKEDELNALRQKSAGLISKQTSEIEKQVSAALGKIPVLEKEIQLGGKYIAGLEKQVKLHPENARLVAQLAAAKGIQLEKIKELNTLIDREIVLTDRYGNVSKTTTGEVARFIEATKDLGKTFQATDGFMSEAMATSLKLGSIFRTQLPSDFGKPVTSLLNLEAAFKTLGITSTKTLQQQELEALAAYKSISQSGTASARDIQLAYAASVQAQIDLMRQMGQKVPADMQDMVDSINKQWGNVKTGASDNIRSIGEIWKNQVSTIVTDFSRGIADILFEGGSFKQKMVDIFKEAGKGIVRAFVEDGLNRVIGVILGKKGGSSGGSSGGGDDEGSLSGALESLQVKFKTVLGNVGGWFKDLFGQISGALKGIGGSIAGLVGGGALLGGGLNIGGKAGTGMSIAGGALMGATIGSFILPGLGTAIGAGIGALAGGIASLFGKDTDKIQDTEIVKKGWPQIWQLQSVFANAPSAESGPAEEANRTAILGAGVTGWNAMASEFKRPESKDTQRPYIFDFIEAVNETFKNRIAGFTDFTPGPLTLPVQPMARGGIVLARPGGTVVRLAEAGQDEAVIPLSRRGGRRGFGSTVNQTINLVADDLQAQRRMLARVNRELVRQLR